jgi:hypothetical protein
MAENTQEKGNKESKQEYVVAGYTFKSKEAADEAKEELKEIKVMSGKTSKKDPNQILSVYNQILEKEMFRTLVGINYLKNLQQFLYLSKDIPNENIRPIPINQDITDVLEGRREMTQHRSQIRSLKRERDKYQRRYVKSIIVNIALVIVLAVFVYITIYSQNTNVLNYRENIENEYASWQEQLQSQEASLRARDKAYNK